MAKSQSTQPVTKRKAPRTAFKPGQSGNPGGLTKAWHEVKAAAQAEGMNCIRKLVELRDHSEDERVQHMATVTLLERGFGKPAQAITDEEGKSIKALGVVILPAESD